MASFFPEKLFNFVQCILCNLDDFSLFLPHGDTKKPPRCRRTARRGKLLVHLISVFFHSSCRVQLPEAEPCACHPGIVVPLRGTHFQPFGKDEHTRRFHFCGNEVGSNRRSLLPSSLHSG